MVMEAARQHQPQPQQRRRRPRPTQQPSSLMVAVAAVGGLLLGAGGGGAGLATAAGAASSSWWPLPLLPGAEAAAAAPAAPVGRRTPVAWLGLKRRQRQQQEEQGQQKQQGGREGAPSSSLSSSLQQRLLGLGGRGLFHSFSFALPPFLASPPPQAQALTRRAVAVAAGAWAPLEQWAEGWRGRLGERGAVVWVGVKQGARRVNATVAGVDRRMEALAAAAGVWWGGWQEECEARRLLFWARLEARRLAAVAAWVHAAAAVDAERRRLLWAVDAAVGEARAAVAVCVGRVIDLSQLLPEEEAVALGVALGGAYGYGYGYGPYGLADSAASAASSSMSPQEQGAQDEEAASRRAASLRRFRPSRLLFSLWRRRPQLGAARSADRDRAAAAAAAVLEEEEEGVAGPSVVGWGRMRKRGGLGGMGGQQQGQQGRLASLNERALRSVLQLAGEGEGDGWERVTSTEGVTVYRKYLDAGSAVGAGAAEEVVCGGGNGGGGGTCIIGEDGVVVEAAAAASPSGVGEEEGGAGGGGAGGVSRFACVKAVGVVDAPVERVFELFMDSARVREYNDHCREIADIATLDPHTKITWSASGRYGPFKVRCSVRLALSRGVGDIPFPVHPHLST